MVKIQHVIIGGWAFNAGRLREHLLHGEKAVVIDVMAICDRLIVNGKLIDNWADVVVDSIRAVTGQECGVNVIGWSTGAIIACAVAGQLNVENLTILSGTLEFCKSERNPYGWPRKIVERMTARLADDRETVMTDFYGRCGMDKAQAAEALSAIEGIDTVTLQNGLRFLMQARIDPAWIKAKNPVRVMHGENDRIIDFRAGEMLASAAGVSITKHPGGHVFWERWNGGMMEWWG